MAIMCLESNAASWQSSIGNNIMMAGVLVSPSDRTNHIVHQASTGGRNLALCQLTCVEKDCDFIAYNNMICVLMNRHVWGWGHQDPRRISGIPGAHELHSTMVNMVKWTDWDMGES